MITGLNDLPIPFAVWMQDDGYDYIADPTYISATSILKPTRAIILNTRLEPENVIWEVDSLVPARFGTAIHEGIEHAWRSPKLKEYLRSLGISEKVNIIINPENTDTLGELDIPVYMEQRSTKQIDGFTIGGKFDFVYNGRLHDFKTTSVYTYMNDSHAKDYILQGSIYRWLNQDKIKDEIVRICYVFTDWSKAASIGNSKYPASRLAYKDYPLMTVPETEAWLRTKLSELKSNWNKPEPELVKCSDEELWRTETSYKYFSKPDATRATKVFSNLPEAQAYKHTAGKDKGIIKVVPGVARRCQYCPGASLCTQKDNL